MSEFFVDAYEAALEEDEILTEIVVPVPAGNAAVRYPQVRISGTSERGGWRCT